MGPPHAYVQLCFVHINTATGARLSPEGEHGDDVQEAHGDVDERAQHREEEGVVVHGVRLQLHEDAVARADEDHHYERHNLQWGNPERENSAKANGTQQEREG